MTATVTPSLEAFEAMKSRNSHLEAEVNWLKEQLAWFQRQLFGAKSERTIDTPADQLLFEGLEEFLEEERQETKEIAAHTRRKANRNGQDALSFPEDIPIEKTLLDVSLKEKTDSDGKPLAKIGEEISQKLCQRPGSFFIKEIIRPKYGLPQGAGVKIAELPESILPKCKADESFLAHILTMKFADHLPLYRISDILARDGIGISRQLLSQWVVKLGEALEPLYEAMKTRILKSGTVFIDETSVKLQAKKKTKEAYVWVLCGAGYRAFSFHRDRKHIHAETLLKDYQGIFHSDKYGAYPKLAKREGIIWCPCWAHIRRKFFDAQSGDPVLREWILGKINALFLIERVACALHPQDRIKMRQEKEIPIIDELTTKIKETLIDGKLLPKSGLREAMGYYMGLVPYLKNYIEHPSARLDNNTAERAIRPLAIGRKNWLFFGSERGGKSGAVILSLVQSCRSLEVNPREYMEDVLRRLMAHPANRLEELLPDEWLKRKKADRPPD